jgi:ABC-type Na+ transport system ATPase subunit NatA
MITIERLTKKCGPTIAVEDISFTAAGGRVTGFLGPNGAGESTTLSITPHGSSAQARRGDAGALALSLASGPRR